MSVSSPPSAPITDVRIPQLPPAPGPQFVGRPPSDPGPPPGPSRPGGFLAIASGFQVKVSDPARWKSGEGRRIFCAFPTDFQGSLSLPALRLARQEPGRRRVPRRAPETGCGQARPGTGTGRVPICAGYGYGPGTDTGRYIYQRACWNRLSTINTAPHLVF